MIGNQNSRQYFHTSRANLDRLHNRSESRDSHSPSRHHYAGGSYSLLGSLRQATNGHASSSRLGKGGQTSGRLLKSRVDLSHRNTSGDTANGEHAKYLDQVLGVQPDFDLNSLAHSAIRQELRAWKEERAHSTEAVPATATSTSKPSWRSVQAQDTDHHRNEDQDFVNSAIDQNSTDLPGRFLLPGDVIQRYYPDRPIALAVCVRGARHGFTGLFLTINGKFEFARGRNILAVASGHIPPRELDSVEEHLQMDPKAAPSLMLELEVPRSVTKTTISRLLTLQAECDRLFREHADDLSALHSFVADEDDVLTISLHSLAATVFGVDEAALTLPQLFVTSSAVRDAGFPFGFDRNSFRFTYAITVQPLSHCRVVEDVKRLIYEWQESTAGAATAKMPNAASKKPKEHRSAISDFLSRAATLITHSRKTRAFTNQGRVAPSQQSNESTPPFQGLDIFDDIDRKIILFIRLWCCDESFSNIGGLAALAPRIIRATGMYDNVELDESTGFTFLQELGLLPPSADPRMYAQVMDIPGYSLSRPLARLSSDVAQFLGPTKDSMEGLRRDWGDLPVFCIDGPDAQEIDDGISIEDPDEHGRSWVHIHIADPTAFIDKDTSVAKYAAHMSKTLYLAEGSIPMLAPALVKACSLAPDRPCLTISVKLDADARLVEHNITSGLVRNVRRLTYDQVRKLLVGGSDNASAKYDLRVGSNGQEDHLSPTPPPEMTATELDQLKRLDTLAERITARNRESDGHVTAPWLGSSQSLLLRGYRNAPLDPMRSMATSFPQDPAIERRNVILDKWFDPAKLGDEQGTLVPRMMQLACMAAADWCAKRQIPLLYRGTKPRPTDQWSGSSPDALPDKPREDRRLVPIHESFANQTLSFYTVISSEPLRHELLKCDSYAQVTSPLRRYSDMVAHWQINAALREEAAREPSADASVRSCTDIVPFSRRELDVLAGQTLHRDRQIDRLSATSDRHWTCQALFRAHYYNEAPLPSPLRAYVLLSGDQQFPWLWVRELDTYFSLAEGQRDILSATARASAGSTEVIAGDTWEIRIVDINTYTGCVKVEPVRLVSRFRDGVECDAESLRESAGQASRVQAGQETVVQGTQAH